MVEQPAEHRIEFPADSLDKIERSCQRSVIRRVGSVPYVEPYCHCYAQSIATYVPREEWQRMLDWERISNDEPRDSSHAQTVFLADVAPTVVAITQPCRARWAPARGHAQ